MRNMVTRWAGIATLVFLQVGHASSSTSPSSPEDMIDAMRKVGIILAQPPLIPISSNPPSLITSDSNIMTVRFADKASVALLKTSQTIELVDLGTAKRIFRDQSGPAQPGPLSPNGRLFITSDSDQLNIRDTQTGAVIAEIPSVLPWEFHWLDERTAFYFDQKYKTYFIDFSSGRTLATGLMNLGIFQTALIPGSPNQYAVLTPNKAFKFELVRNKSVPELKLLAEKVVSMPGLSNASSTTSDGKYFFNSVSHLTLLNLRSLESEEISLEPFYLQTSMATSDPDEIIVTGFIQPSDGAVSPDYLYSISKRSLAQIRPDKQSSLLRRIYIRPFRRLGIISGSEIAVMDELKTAENISVADFAREARGKSEQNKIAVDERKQARENACRPSKEKNKDGIELYALGIYEGPLGRNKSAKNKVDIAVYRSEQPIVLALFNYEPVTWNIRMDKGAAIREIILNSSDGTQLTGINGKSIKVTRQNFGYTADDDCNFFSMVAPKLKEFSGLNTTSFQGASRGIGFAVRPHNMTPPVAASAPTPAPAPVTKSAPALEQGLEAYERGDYRTAREDLMPLAEKGIAMAQNTIGKMYMQGQEVPKDYRKALLLFRKAAQQKLPNAQNNLGVMYAGGYGVPQDFKQAIEWFKKAADQDYVIAMNNLADLYEGGVGISKDPIAAEKWRNRAQGRAQTSSRDEVAVELGGSEDYKKGLDLYYDGRMREAFCPLLSAAKKGHPEAQLKLESMYRHGQGGNKDERKAQYWARQAATRLQELAQASGKRSKTVVLAGGEDYEKGLNLYRRGKLREAFCHLLPAAQKGHPEAQLKLESIYRLGQGGEKDARQAQYWTKKAAAKGYSNNDGRDRIFFIDTSSEEEPRTALGASALTGRMPDMKPCICPTPTPPEPGCRCPTGLSR